MTDSSSNDAIPIYFQPTEPLVEIGIDEELKMRAAVEALPMKM